MYDIFLQNKKFCIKIFYFIFHSTFIFLKNVKFFYIGSFMTFLISALLKLSATFEIHLSFPHMHAFPT